jgi:transcriptional regulator with XRE-family HTH domain
MSIGEHVGERIRQARVSKGLSVGELAAAAQVTATAVYYWEQNRTKPRPGALRKIAACLDVSEEFLWIGHSRAEGPAAMETPSIAEMVEETRVRIAQATGFPLDRVKLHLEFD